MKISAIICTSKRPAALNRLLRALLGQNRLPDQIIVVEDRQGPEPRQILQSLREKGVQVCYFRRACPGLTASRNLALTHAQGQLLSFFGVWRASTNLSFYLTIGHVATNDFD